MLVAYILIGVAGAAVAETTNAHELFIVLLLFGAF